MNRPQAVNRRQALGLGCLLAAIHTGHSGHTAFLFIGMHWRAGENATGNYQN